MSWKRKQRAVLFFWGKKGQMTVPVIRRIFTPCLLVLKGLRDIMIQITQPRRLTLYTTVLLATLLVYMSSKLYYGASVHAPAMTLGSATAIPGQSRNGQDENIYDFEDFEGDRDTWVMGDGNPNTNADIDSKGESVETRGRQLVQLAEETKVLREAVRAYSDNNTKGRQHYLKDYIASLDALTQKHQHLLREFTQMKQDGNFTDFVEDKRDWSMEDVRIVPVKHNVKTTNLSPLDTPSPQTASPRQCKSPAQNVAFVKVHKAGSTTVQNLLQRYALHNKLNVVLPNKNKSKDPHYHYLGENGKLSKSGLIPIPSNESFNMLFNHAVFNAQAFQAVLPSDTHYLAIVREPEDRFISAAFFYGLVKRLYSMVPNLNTTRYIFTSYLQNPSNYIINHYFYNAMSYDFGVPQSVYENPKQLITYAKSLAKEFDLVMLLEYFDHSLILLKRRLCWDLKDILYLPRNKGARTGSNNFLLSENDKILLRNWQTSEFILYKVFSNAFWAKVSEEGEDFFNEVSQFKDIISYVKAFCLNPMRKGVLSVKQSRWSTAFTVSKDDCRYMAAKEIVLHDRLVQKQWEKYRASLSH